MWRRRQPAEAFEAQIQLAAGPCVCRGVAELFRREIRTRPIRRLRALRDPSTEKQPRQVAQAGLYYSVMFGDVAKIDNIHQREREQLLQLREITRQGDAR